MNSEHAAKLLSEDKIERLKQYDEASYNTAMQRRYELERDGYEINDAPKSACYMNMMPTAHMCSI